MKYYLLILALLTSTTLAETWTVDDDGKADFDNIQAAIDAASDGDEIIVAPGTYTSTQDAPVVDMLGKAVLLRGSGGPVATIIQGGGYGSRGIFCGNGEMNSTVIEGFTITGCNAGQHHWGGGIYNFGSPTLTNCIIANNVADAGGGIWNHGANASPTLTNCIIKDNLASSNDGGAGIYNYGGSSPTLIDTVVCGNKMGQIYGNWTDGGGNTVDNNCPPPDDADSDGTPDKYDNCYLYNPDQADCNGNEIGDICDIADGTSYDINGNTIPDECEDSDGDGVPDNIDVFPNDPNEWADSDGDGVGDNEDTAPQGGCCVSTGCYQTTAVACDGLGGTWLDASASCDNCPAICNEDINGDGVIDVSDLLAIIAAWGACP